MKRSTSTERAKMVRYFKIALFLRKQLQATVIHTNTAFQVNTLQNFFRAIKKQHHRGNIIY